MPALQKSFCLASKSVYLAGRCCGCLPSRWRGWRWPTWRSLRCTSKRRSSAIRQRRMQQKVILRLLRPQRSPKVNSLGSCHAQSGITAENIQEVSPQLFTLPRHARGLTLAFLDCSSLGLPAAANGDAPSADTSRPATPSANPLASTRASKLSTSEVTPQLQCLENPIMPCSCFCSQGSMTACGVLKHLLGATDTLVLSKRFAQNVRDCELLICRRASMGR